MKWDVKNDELLLSAPYSTMSHWLMVWSAQDHEVSAVLI